MLGESTQVKIDVTGDQLVIVFDHKCDHFLCPWQDAFDLAKTLSEAIAGLDKSALPDSRKLNQECTQVKLNALTMGHAKGLVAIVFEWTNRLAFTWRSASAFRDALKLKADDARQALNGIHFVYNAQGMIKELHDLRNGTIQTIPDR